MMSINKAFPFMIKGVAADCDTTMEMGTYYTELESTGNPFVGYADLIVFNCMAIGSWTVQLMFQTGKNKFYFRATGGISFVDVPWNEVTGIII